MVKLQPEKLIGASLDISAENRAHLKQIFPSVFTETKNDQGESVESIDFEKLKAELGTFSDLFENRRERYGMDWPGKKEALRLIQTPSRATLKPCREESVNFDSTENLYIEGDNLEVLKLLQKSYYGKVKMIYIDPPYNTGNEFIYPDNFTENLQTYLEYAGLADRDGKKFSTNTANEGRFHTKWLNMMYPRLYLARNLLRDDGVIFISIDDNELNNLRKLCDEVFGEENFVASVIWEKRTTRENRSVFSVRHDYIFIYTKLSGINEDTIGLLPMDQSALERYRNPDNDPRGNWTSVPAIAQAGHGTKNQFYSLTTPSGRIVDPPSGSCWRYTKQKMEDEINNNNIWFGADGNGVPRIKKFITEGRQGLTPETIWWAKDVGTNDSAKRTLVDLFNGIAVFETPKPETLVQRMVNLSDDKDGVFLDFFSGTAPLAHSVLAENKQDGGNRKFIMVQLPEPCTEDSEAFKAGYRTIADIGKERIRRVIKKLNAEQEGKLDLENDKEQDRGFRVLKLNESNFKQWRELPPATPTENIIEQLELHIDHISHTATQEDLLVEILLKAGFMPTAKAEALEFAGKKVFAIAEGALLICLEETVTKEMIDAVVATEPQQFICLDAAFGGNDQLKANTVQTFAAHNMQKEKHNQIVFRTV